MSSGISGVGGLTPLPRSDGDNLRTRRRASQGSETGESAGRAADLPSADDQAAALPAVSASGQLAEDSARAARALATPQTVAVAARRAYGGSSDSSQSQRDAVARSNREAANGGHPIAINNAIEALQRLRTLR